VRLADKVCIVTGADSGIARASAELFAAEGARVVGADIDGEAVGVTHQVDVGDEEQTVELAAAVVEEFGRIDVLFPAEPRWRVLVSNFDALIAPFAVTEAPRASPCLAVPRGF
jgi:hypothetical protein